MLVIIILIKKISNRHKSKNDKNKNTHFLHKLYVEDIFHSYRDKNKSSEFIYHINNIFFKRFDYFYDLYAFRSKDFLNEINLNKILLRKIKLNNEFMK